MTGADVVVRSDRPLGDAIRAAVARGTQAGRVGDRVRGGRAGDDGAAGWCRRRPAWSNCARWSRRFRFTER